MSSAFHILGSSSGLPQAERACSGFALEIDSRISLIDCGGGVVQSFLSSELEPANIDQIFISHTHPDHCSDLPLFIQMIHHSGRTDQVDLFVPEEYVEPLNISIRAMYLIPERFAFKLNIHGYIGGFIFSEANNKFKLTAISNNHFARQKKDIERLSLPNKCQSHSFLIEAGEKMIFYSGDIASIDEITEHAVDSDLVITELTHVEVDSFLEWAKSKPEILFIISHLGNPDEVALLQVAIQLAELENIALANDGMVLEF